MCLYRAPGGSKCAVGALIPDELYDHSAEDTTLEPAAGFGKFLPYDYALTALDFVFLRGAQGRLHDNLTNNGFEAQLEAAAASFAKDYDLNVPA